MRPGVDTDFMSLHVLLDEDLRALDHTRADDKERRL